MYVLSKRQVQVKHFAKHSIPSISKKLIRRKNERVLLYSTVYHQTSLKTVALHTPANHVNKISKITFKLKHYTKLKVKSRKRND